MSLVVIGILMTTIGSVMVVTGRAVSLSASQAGEAKVDDVIATLAAEHRLASRILERTPTSITFTVDRDHDGVFDTIRYSWSGVSGDPLLRQLNGGAATVVASDVRRFNLDYVVKSTAAVAAPVPDVENGVDVLLYAHDAGSAGSSVSTTNWGAQYFKPDWTAVAPGKTVTAWRVTKVEVVASKAVGSSGVTPWLVRLYSATSDTDRRPLLTDKREEQTLPVSSMATTNTPTVRISTPAFTANSGLDPSKGMCITVGPNAFSPTGFVGMDTASSDGAGALSLSTNTGATYGVASTTRDMRIRVWGRYKYPGP